MLPISLCYQNGVFSKHLILALSVYFGITNSSRAKQNSPFELGINGRSVMCYGTVKKL